MLVSDSRLRWVRRAVCDWVGHGLIMVTPNVCGEPGAKSLADLMIRDQGTLKVTLECL